MMMALLIILNLIIITTMLLFKLKEIKISQKRIYKMFLTWITDCFSKSIEKFCVYEMVSPEISADKYEVGNSNIRLRNKKITNTKNINNDKL